MPSLPFMKRLSPKSRRHIFVWAIFVLCSTAVACSTYDVEQDSRTRRKAESSRTDVVPNGPVAASSPASETPECDDEHSLWVLAGDGSWSRNCLDAPLERNTAAWTSDSQRLIGFRPQGCIGPPEPLFGSIAKGSHVGSFETTLSSHVVTKGSAVAVDETGLVHTYGGEWCARRNTVGQHTTWKAGGDATLELFSEELVWPVMFARDNHVLVSGGLILTFGELDVSTAPGLTFESNSVCFFVHPDEPGDYYHPRFCGRGPNEYVTQNEEQGTWFSRADVDGKPILPPGRELTWVYDAKHDRIVSVAFFEPNMWASSEMDPTPLLWKVDRRAWTIPKDGKPAQLPDPPIIGDGVTLLYNPELEQVILFDPFGTKSWSLAVDDSAWEEWRTHEPLPLPTGVTLPENTRGTEHRFTQWWAPYFAYWDVERGGPTVVFYDEPHSLCLPVEGLGDTYACPKSHS